MTAQWYYRVSGETVGPVVSAELLAKAKAGQIGPDTPVRKGPAGNWMPAQKVRGLFAPESPVIPEIRTPPPEAPHTTSRGTTSSFSNEESDDAWDDVLEDVDGMPDPLSPPPIKVDRLSHYRKRLAEDSQAQARPEKVDRSFSETCQFVTAFCALGILLILAVTTVVHEIRYRDGQRKAEEAIRKIEATAGEADRKTAEWLTKGDALEKALEEGDEEAARRLSRELGIGR